MSEFVVVWALLAPGDCGTPRTRLCPLSPAQRVRDMNWQPNIVAVGAKCSRPELERVVHESCAAGHGDLVE